MRLQRIIASVIITALLFSGCTSLSLGSSEILTPPKATGIRADVQRLIEDDAKGSYTLIYPTAGANKNGMFLHDINHDGIDEAFALYTAADKTPRILIAQQRQNAFQLYGCDDLYSSNVTELSFTDFDGNGEEELLISYGIGTSHTALETFLTADGLVKSNVEEGFLDYVTGDFDGNATIDLLLMTPREDDAHATAKLMAFGEEGFSEKSLCEIDSNVISYTGLRFGRISANLSGAAADGKLENGEHTTQLIYYDSAAKILVNPLYMNNHYKQNIRNSSVTCLDIDDDGILDVPLSAVMDHREDEDVSSVCNVARWNDYDPEQMGLSFKQDAVLCEKLGFMLLFATEKLKTITARYSADNAVTLYRVSYKNSVPVLGGVLLTVYRYEKNSDDSSQEGQTLLDETDAYTYTYLLSEDSSISRDDIKNSFMLLSPDDDSSPK